MLPKTSIYIKSCDDQTKWMYFLIEDDDFLEKYNTIWDKVRAGDQKEFDSESVYNKSFLKPIIKSYDDDATDFHDKEAPKVDSNHTCLLTISLDSILEKKLKLLPASVFKRT